MIKSNTILFSLILLSSSIFANTTAIQEQNTPQVTQEIAEIQKDEKQELMIGYYGRPKAKSLGILGHSNIEELVKKIRTKCDEFSALNENHDIKPAFHIIYGLATIEPGRDGDYIKNLHHDTLMQYIEAAQKENFAVIIDLQLGVLEPIEAVKPVLKYLQYDNVHLALDPEFKIPSHRKYPPGKFVGHIFGNDINEVQNSMQTYMQENGIEGERKLLVHMFHKRMIRKKEDIKNFDNVDLIFNIDGHGNIGTKIKIYNSLYNEANSKIANSGFKVFYEGDVAPLATPKQILGLEKAGTRKVKRIPTYINYH